MSSAFARWMDIATRHRSHASMKNSKSTRKLGCPPSLGESHSLPPPHFQWLNWSPHGYLFRLSRHRSTELKAAGPIHAATRHKSGTVAVRKTKTPNPGVFTLFFRHVRELLSATTRRVQSEAEAWRTRVGQGKGSGRQCCGSSTD